MAVLKRTAKEKAIRNRGYLKFCVQCGKPFESRRPEAQFCGATCRKRRNRLDRFAGLQGGAGLPVLRPANVVAQEHADADRACGRNWVCACAACRIAREKRRS